MLLAGWGIFAHIILQQAFNVGIFQDHRVQPDILADKQAKFIRRDFGQTFKPGYLGLVAQFCNGVSPLLIAVEVNGFLFIAHPEQ